MAWVAVGAAAVTVVGGYLSSKQQQKAQSKAAKFLRRNARGEERGLDGNEMHVENEYLLYVGC